MKTSRPGWLQKINSGLTLFFGLTTMLASFCGVVGLLIWFFRIATDRARFSWFGFGGIVVVSFILFVISIIVMKNAVDEMKKKE